MNGQFARVIRRHTALVCTDVPTYGPRDRGAIQYSCCLELLPAVTLDANVAVSLFQNHKRNVVINWIGGDSDCLVDRVIINEVAKQEV